VGIVIGVLMKKSFKGTVVIYKESVYIDTDTGEGVGFVLKKIDPLLSKMASKYFISGYQFNDKKQLLSIIAMEGIRSYNPDKGASLSTFLHRHLRNKFISKLRSENKISNDAFGLYSTEEECDCGGSILPGDGIKFCDLCGRRFSEKFKRARPEIGFSQIRMVETSDGEPELFENTLSQSNGMYKESDHMFSRIDFRTSLSSAIKDIDPVTLVIMELIYFEDYSIKDAAKMVGLTGWAASMKLKKLSENEKFAEVFGKITGESSTIKPTGVPG